MQEGARRMPGSAQEGKTLVRDFIKENNLKTFLDIGPGEGTYYDALKGIGFYQGLEPLEIEQIDGVEFWAPYISQYRLYEKYDHLIVADVRHLDWFSVPREEYDMVFLGDIIEHMPVADGVFVINAAANVGRYVVVSLPIYGYAQHVGWEGNWAETHVEQYSDESIKKILNPYGLLAEMQGSIVGAYIIKGLI